MIDETGVTVLSAGSVAVTRNAPETESNRRNVKDIRRTGFMINRLQIYDFFANRSSAEQEVGTGKL